MWITIKERLEECTASRRLMTDCIKWKSILKEFLQIPPYKYSQTSEPLSHLFCLPQQEVRFVALIVCGLVCRLWLKSDNQTVGHSCWPTFLPQLHRVYHQGLLAGSGLAPGPDSDPPPLLLPRFKWRRVGQYSHLCIAILACVCGVQFSQHQQTFLIFQRKLIHCVMHSNDLFGESVIP